MSIETRGIELIVKFASLADEAGRKDLKNRFAYSIVKQLTAAMGDRGIGHIAALIDDVDDDRQPEIGLLLATITGYKQHRAAMQFARALADMSSTNDEELRKRGERFLAAMNKAAIDFAVIDYGGDRKTSRRTEKAE